MVGSALLREFGRAGLETLAPGSRQLDITRAPDIETFLRAHPVDVVVNCAVWKDFSDAASCRHGYLVNAQAPQWLAAAATGHGAHLIQLSTDVVFAPEPGPFDEDRRAAPEGPYATSKWQGEVASALVIRGSFVGPGGRRWPSIVDRLQAGGEVRAGRDELWNGLTSLELAALLAAYILNGRWIIGIRHVFGADTTRYAFMEEARLRLKLPGKVVDNGRSRDLRLATRFADLLPGRPARSTGERIDALAPFLAARG